MPTAGSPGQPRVFRCRTVDSIRRTRGRITVWWFGSADLGFTIGRGGGGRYFFGTLSHAVYLCSSSCLHFPVIPLRPHFPHPQLLAFPWRVDDSLCVRLPISPQNFTEHPLPHFSLPFPTHACASLQCFRELRILVESMRVVPV